MPQTYESFRNLASSVQSWTLSIAVIIGGGWTLYTFVALDLEEKAQRELFAQAQVSVKVLARQEIFDSCSTCVAAFVELTNTGRQNVFLDYTEAPFSVNEVLFNSDGSSRLGDEIRQANYLWASRVLRSGETVAYPFSVKVPNAGMYLVQFRVPLPEAEMKYHRDVGGSAGKIYWDGATIVTVTSGEPSLQRERRPS